MNRSASVIGLYNSYAIPIFLRITSGRDKLKAGPFSLGKWYLPIGIVAVTWVLFITILLLFPGASNPPADEMSTWFLVSSGQITKYRIDYAVVLVGSVFIFASVWWIISAHKWFKGPISNVDEDPLEKSVQDYSRNEF